MAGDVRHKVVKINQEGCFRVLEGRPGMTFIVDHFTGSTQQVAAVRDYRFPDGHKPFQIWSIGSNGYEMVD